MGRPRTLVASSDAALGALVKWVHDRLDETGTTYEQIASDMAYSRSWVSRELCGRRLPRWELIETVAGRCGAPSDEARRLYEAAEAAQLRRQARRVVTYPPSDIDSWRSMDDALGALIARTVGSHRELERRDGSGLLKRSTIGAILRYDRSLSYDVLVQVLTICGVGDKEWVAWMDAWERYGRWRRKILDGRRRAIARRRLQPGRYSRARESW
jgi:transcriptional regulator with XRE-family HTH domain